MIEEKPATEIRLQFATREIVDIAEDMGQDNYRPANAYEEVNIASVRRHAKIISSHDFSE